MIGNWFQQIVAVMTGGLMVIGGIIWLALKLGLDRHKNWAIERMTTPLLDQATASIEFEAILRNMDVPRDLSAGEFAFYSSNHIMSSWMKFALLSRDPSPFINKGLHDFDVTITVKRRRT